MYEQATKSALVEERRPELANIYERLAKCNSENISLLQQVEEKLHNIINKRTPEKERASESVVSGNDFVAGVNQQLNYYESNIGYLQRILNHLSSII